MSTGSSGRKTSKSPSRAQLRLARTLGHDMRDGEQCEGFMLQPRTLVDTFSEVEFLKEACWPFQSSARALRQEESCVAFSGIKSVKSTSNASGYNGAPSVLDTFRCDDLQYQRSRRCQRSEYEQPALSGHYTKLTKSRRAAFGVGAAQRGHVVPIGQLT